MSRPKKHLPGQVRWTTERAVPRGIKLDMLRPKVGQTLDVVAVGDHVLGVDVHWEDRWTIPCLGSAEACRKCREGQSWRRCWYLMVATKPALKLAVLCLTNGAVEANPRLYPEMPSLRGCHLQVTRAGGFVQARMFVKITKEERPDRLPQPLDLKSALLRIWGYEEGSDIG